jgi:hypothetical protein
MFMNRRKVPTTVGAMAYCLLYMLDQSKSEHIQNTLTKILKKLWTMIKGIVDGIRERKSRALPDCYKKICLMQRNLT